MIQNDPVNILLVDDQPAKLLSYDVVLAELGETLLKASSAREALALLLKNDVGVVLIDVEMPDMDGFELAAMIREHPRFQQTALIFVSAVHLTDLDRLKGYEAGGVDYVPVPIVPELLRAKVRVFAELHRKTRQLERLNAELERRVTERTEALEHSRSALADLNRQLEARIEQKTREREEALQQLFEAQKLDTIGQLTGGVAHDFNNLLMAMLGSLELLKKWVPDEPRARRLLENATQGAERGRALTQRLLAFARRQELRPVAVHIPTLVHSMQELLKGSIGPTILVRQHLPDELDPVLADPNQLELALLNLCLNARDAMPDGGTISISATEAWVDHAAATAELRPGGYVRLVISDTGCGMDPATLARATEPFFTTKGTGKGTGLGLSMVHGLAAQSGGKLRIQSTPGHGTRVELLLPKAEQDAGASEMVKAALAPSSGWQAKILLVDDDALVSTGTAAMLEDLGHAVIEAGTAAEALDLLEEHSDIDLVITDHAMPGMTGAELAREIRARYPDMAVILATGFAELATSAAPPAIPRLAKPYTQSDLISAIASYGASAPRAEAV